MDDFWKKDADEYLNGLAGTTKKPSRVPAPKVGDKDFRKFFTDRGFNVVRTFGKALNPKSLHPYGKAADISIKGKDDESIGALIEDAVKLGYRVVDERKPIKGVNQTGPHLHFERNDNPRPSVFLPQKYGTRDITKLQELDNIRLGKASPKLNIFEDDVNEYLSKEIDDTAPYKGTPIPPTRTGPTNPTGAPPIRTLVPTPVTDAVKEGVKSVIQPLVGSEPPVRTSTGYAPAPPRTYIQRDIQPGQEYYEFEQTRKAGDLDYLGISNGQHYFKDAAGDEYALDEQTKKIVSLNPFPRTLKFGDKPYTRVASGRYKDKDGEEYEVEATDTGFTLGRPINPFQAVLDFGESGKFTRKKDDVYTDAKGKEYKVGFTDGKYSIAPILTGQEKELHAQFEEFKKQTGLEGEDAVKEFNLVHSLPPHPDTQPRLVPQRRPTAVPQARKQAPSVQDEATTQPLTTASQVPQGADLVLGKHQPKAKSEAMAFKETLLALNLGATPQQIDAYIKQKGGKVIEGGYVPGDIIHVRQSTLEDIIGPSATKQVVDRRITDAQIAANTSEAPIAYDEFEQPITRRDAAFAAGQRATAEREARLQLEKEAETSEVAKYNINDPRSVLHFYLKDPITQGIRLYDLFTKDRPDIAQEVKQVTQEQVASQVRQAGSARKALDTRKNLEQMPGFAKLAPSLTTFVKGMVVDNIAPAMQFGGIFQNGIERYILGRDTKAQDNLLFTAGTSMKEAFDRGTPSDDATLSGSWGVERVFGQVLGTLIMAATGTKLLGLTAKTGGYATATAIGVPQVTSKAYTRAIKSGATEDQANLAALLAAPGGLLEGLSERMILGKLSKIQKLDAATNGAFSKGVMSKLKEAGKTYSSDFAKGGAAEWLLEEVPQQLLSSTAAKLAYEKEGVTLRGFAKDLDAAIRDSAIAFFVGGTLNVGAQIAQRSQATPEEPITPTINEPPIPKPTAPLEPTALEIDKPMESTGEVSKVVTKPPQVEAKSKENVVTEKPPLEKKLPEKAQGVEPRAIPSDKPVVSEKGDFLTQENAAKQENKVETIQTPDFFHNNRPAIRLGESGKGKTKIQYLDGKRETPSVLTKELTKDKPIYQSDLQQEKKALMKEWADLDRQLTTSLRNKKGSDAWHIARARYNAINERFKQIDQELKQGTSKPEPPQNIEPQNVTTSPEGGSVPVKGQDKVSKEDLQSNKEVESAQQLAPEGPAEKGLQSNKDQTEGLLYKAKQDKAKAWKQVKKIRDQIKNSTMRDDRAGMRVELLKWEGLHKEALRTEQSILADRKAAAPAKEQGKDKVNENAKEPWEMTQAEYAADFEQRDKATRAEMVADLDKKIGGRVPQYRTVVGRREIASKEDAALKELIEKRDSLAKPRPDWYYSEDSVLDHKRKIKEALGEGKPVPANVLADYPDLKVADSGDKVNENAKEPWYAQHGEATQEKIFEAMRKIDARVDAANQAERKLRPQQGSIAVGAAGFDEFMRAEAPAEVIRHIRRGLSPEEAGEKAKEWARDAVAKHNEKRAKDMNWQRSEIAGDNHIDRVVRELTQATKAPDLKVADKKKRIEEKKATPKKAPAKKASAKAMLIPGRDRKKYAAAGLTAEEVQEQVSDPAFIEAEKKSQTQKEDKNGFTPAQKVYIAKAIEAYAKDYPKDAPYGAEGIDTIRKDNKTVEQPYSSRTHSIVVSSRRATEIDPEVIIVPDDGTFRITDLQQANRLYQKVTGKPLKGQPKEKLPSRTVFAGKFPGPSKGTTRTKLSHIADLESRGEFTLDIPIAEVDAQYLEPAGYEVEGAPNFSEGWARTSLKGKQAFTDGHILLALDEPPGKSKTIKEPDSEKILQASLKDTPKPITPERAASTFADSAVYIEFDSGASIPFRQYNLIRQNYPKAVFAQAYPDSAIIIKNGKDIVGMVMPQRRQSSQPTDQPLRMVPRDDPEALNAAAPFIMDGIEIEFIDPDDGVQDNASGESVASKEAINRAKGEKDRGEYRVAVNTLTGIETKILADVNAVDAYIMSTRFPVSHLSIEWRGGKRDGEVIARADNARPYRRKKDQPLRMVATPENRLYLEDVLPYADDIELIARSEAEIKDGNLHLNPEAGELLRRVFAGAGMGNAAFYGVTVNRENVTDAVNYIREAIPQFRKAGYHTRDVRALVKLATTLQKMAKEMPNNVAYVFDEALPEETHHRDVLNLGGISKKAIDEIEKVYWEPLGKGYEHLEKKNNRHSKAVEIAAKMETGQIKVSDDIREKVLTILADDIIDRHTNKKGEVEIDFARYERIVKYANTQTGNTGRSETRKADTEGIAGTKGSDRAPSEGTRPDREVGGQDRGEGRKQKDRQFAVSMALAGLDIGDVKYDPQTFKGELAKAHDHLAGAGVDQAMIDWLGITDAAQKMALGTVIAYELHAQNRIPDLIAFGTQLTENSGSHGAGLVFSKLMTRLSPAWAQIEAAKRVRKGQQREPTPQELEKVNNIALELEKANEDYARATATIDDLDTKLAEANRTIKRLEDALKDEQSPPSKEELRKRIQKAQAQASYYKKLVEEHRETKEKSKGLPKKLKEIEAEKADLLKTIGDIFKVGDAQVLYMVAPSLNVPGAEALIKLSTLKLHDGLAEGMTPEAFDTWLNRLTNGQLSQIDVETIHALAMTELKGTPMSDEAKVKMKNRRDHAKRAYNVLHDVEAEKEQRQIESLDRQIEALEAADVKEVGKEAIDLPPEIAARKQKLKELRQQRKEILESRRGEQEKYDDLAKAMVGLAHQLDISPEGVFIGMAMRSVKDPRILQHTFKEFYPDGNFNKALVEGDTLLKTAKDALKHQKLEMAQGVELTLNQRRHLEFEQKSLRSQQRLKGRALEAELKQLERTPAKKFAFGILDVYNALRAIMYSVDAGAALAPGFLTLTTSPSVWAKSLRDAGAAFEARWLNEKLRKRGTLGPDQGISAFVRKVPGFDKVLRGLGMNNASFEQVVTRHWDDPIRPRAESQGLKFEEIGSKRDWNEGRMSNIAEAIPVIGHSNRFHGLATDLFRLGHAKRYIEQLDKLEAAGKISAENRMLAEDFLMRKWANAITGKGYLGMLEQAAWAASQLMSAPRFMVSAFQVPYYANPLRIAAMPKGARQIVAKDAAKIYGVAGALMAVFGALGWINLDPEDKDFLTLNANKIPGLRTAVPDMKIKPVRWLQEPVRLAMGLSLKYAWYAMEGNQMGQERIKKEWFSELVASDFGGIGTFWKGRLHPTIGLIKANVTGKDFVDEPIGWEDVEKYLPLPLSLGEGLSALKYDKKQSILKTGDAGNINKNWGRLFATMVLNGIGLGVNTYPSTDTTAAGKQAVSMMSGDMRPEDEKAKSRKANQLERLIRDNIPVNVELQNALANNEITAKQAEYLADILADEIATQEKRFGIKFTSDEKQILMQHRRAFKLLDYLWGGSFQVDRNKINATLRFATRRENTLNDRAAQAEAEAVLLRALLRSKKVTKP